jgi:hypothetical protein
LDTHIPSRVSEGIKDPGTPSHRWLALAQHPFLFQIPYISWLNHFIFIPLVLLLFQKDIFGAGHANGKKGFLRAGIKPSGRRNFSSNGNSRPFPRIGLVKADSPSPSASAHGKRPKENDFKILPLP